MDEKVNMAIKGDVQAFSSLIDGAEKPHFYWLNIL